MNEEDEMLLNAQRHSLGTWARIYLHGCIAIGVMLLIVYLFSRLRELFDFTGSSAVAITLTIMVLLLGPPLVGSLILFVLFPLIGKKEAWRGLLAWDDRLVNEVSRARQQAQIVIINWPNAETRTLGVLTARIKGNENELLGAVYVPTAPQTRFGYIRIVRMDDIEFTDWTLRQWQLYQFTFGAMSPESLLLPAPES